MRLSSLKSTCCKLFPIFVVVSKIYPQVVRRFCLGIYHLIRLYCTPVIREIKILKRLRHPNLVQMLEVVSSKGVEYLDVDDDRSPRDENCEKEGDEAKQSRSKQQLTLSQSSGGTAGGDSKAETSNKKDHTVDAREGYKGNLFIVLEYVSHDLTGLMDVAYKFTVVQVKSIFKQLLEALNYMHESKYIHRDIKSSNILIDHNFRVKLADFGLARCIETPILDKIHEYVDKVIAAARHFILDHVARILAIGPSFIRHCFSSGVSRYRIHHLPHFLSFLL
jgi:serine/threonine protein kinase